MNYGNLDQLSEVPATNTICYHRLLGAKEIKVVTCMLCNVKDECIQPYLNTNKHTYIETNKRICFLTNRSVVVTNVH